MALHSAAKIGSCNVALGGVCEGMGDLTRQIYFSPVLLHVLEYYSNIRRISADADGRIN